MTDWTKAETTAREHLHRLCNEFGAHFTFDAAQNVWTLSGTDQDGNVWETDDYAASGYKEAIQSAIAYLEEENDVMSDDDRLAEEFQMGKDWGRR